MLDIDLNDTQNFESNAAHLDEIADTIFSHEAVHAMGGKGYVDIRDVNWEKAYDENFRPSKQGLFFAISDRKFAAQRDKKKNPKPRFFWLDEALTETTNKDILQKDQPTTREKECRLYELLRRKAGVDLPHGLFQEAYFEDFDPHAAPGQRLPKWNELRRKIKEGYDSRLLVELDDFILAYGVEGLDKAIEFLDGLEKGEYGRKNKTLQEIRAVKAVELGLGQNAHWDEIEEGESKLAYWEKVTEMVK